MGHSGLLNQLTKNVLETALDAEMAEHLGYERRGAVGRGSGNFRNGTRSKTVLTQIGPVEITVWQVSMRSYCPLLHRGLTTGEVSAHFLRHLPPQAGGVPRGDGFEGTQPHASPTKSSVR
jgi:putative transposase